MYLTRHDDIPLNIERFLRNEGQEFIAQWARGHYQFIFPTQCILWVTPHGGVSWLRRHNFRPQELADELEARAYRLAKLGKIRRRKVRRNLKRLGLR